MSSTEKSLRMRDVCARTGLTRSTIHHYIREGVLPKPEKTGRNTAVYDEDFVRRAQLVKTLQEKTHMPLAEIRDTIETMPTAAVDAIDLDRFASVTATVAANLRIASSREVSRTELLSVTGLTSDDLDGLIAAKLVTPSVRGTRTTFAPWDVRIAQAISRIRTAGATSEAGFTGSPDIINAYRTHLTELARTEAKEMMRMLGPLAEIDIESFVQRIVEPLGVLVAAMHHRALIHAVTELTNDGGTDGRS